MIYSLLHKLSFKSVFVTTVLVVILTCNTIAQNIRDRNIHWGSLNNKLSDFTPYNNPTIEEEFFKHLIYGQNLFDYNPYTKSLVRGVIKAEYSQTDSLSWGIAIEDNIIFQDGNQLTSEDVKFSIDFYKEFHSNNKESYNHLTDRIVKVAPQGNKFILIDLQRKVESLPMLVADIPILSKDYYKGNTFTETLQNIQNKMPLGLGPFNYVARNENNILISTINRTDNSNGPENLSISLYNSLNLMTAEFITGKLDVIPIYTSEQLREITRADSAFKIVNIPLPYEQMIFVDFNIDTPILMKNDVREALILAFRRVRYPQAFIELNDIRSMATGPIPEDSWSYHKPPSRQIYFPSKSMKILHDNNWRDSNGDGLLDKNGTALSVELLYPEGDIYLDMLVRLIKTDLGEIGVQVREIPLPTTELKNRTRSDNFQIILDSSRFYPHNIVKSFINLFDYYDINIHRNKPDNRSAETSRQLRRAILNPNQFISEAIFKRIQEIYYQSRTSAYLVRVHHRYIAINSRRIDNFMRNDRLLQPNLWQIK